MNGKGNFLNQALGYVRLARILDSGMRAHRAMERDFSDRLVAVTAPSMTLDFPNREINAAKYFERNIFSILFLSVFLSLGIPEPRVRAYGLVLHSLRGVVTSTDNILDEETKGAVSIQGATGNVLPNVMLLLLQSGLLHDVLSELAPDPGQRTRVQARIITALQAIATEEGEEEQEINEVLDPAALLERIHRFRGGRLLELAFVAPVAIEVVREKELQQASAAVHHIGLGLQILDDITDLALDLESRNHNILRSWIVHHGPDGALTDHELQKQPRAGLQRPWQSFPRATQAVLELATGEARSGFSALGQLGFPIDEKGIEDLLGWLFRARGLQELWKIRNA